jgi:hypothetical protein
MDQLPRLGPPTFGRSPIGRPGPVGMRIAADDRLERSSQLMLKIGAALAAVFVLLPFVGVAAVMVLLASLDTWHGGEARLTFDDRLGFLMMAVVVVGIVNACAVALRRSLRCDWIALAVVGLGGLTCVCIGVYGIGRATGIDSLITALSWGVATTGVVLVLGASLAVAARARGARPPA